MKKEIKDKLDREAFKSKVKIYTIFAIPLLIMGVLFIAFFPISSSNIQVSAFKYTAEQTDFGNIPIMWAKLDDKTTIRISMPNNIDLKNNAKAEVIKTNTLIGSTTYKFVQYVN